MHEQALNHSLHNLRGRVRRICLGEGLGYALAAGLALLMVAMWIDLVVNLPPTARLLANAVTLLCGLSLIALSVGRMVRRSSLTSLARNLDMAAGSGGQ